MTDSNRPTRTVVTALAVVTLGAILLLAAGGAAAQDGTPTETPTDGIETGTPTEGTDTATPTDGIATETPTDGTETEDNETETPTDGMGTEETETETETPTDGVGEDEETVAGEDVQLRVLHASPDAPAVDVYVDGALAVENLTYENVTEYTTLEAGEHEVEVTVAGEENETVLSENVTLDPGNYTAYAAGEVDENATQPLQLGLLADGDTGPEGEGLVRLVHLSPDAPMVDVVVADVDIPLAENVSFGNATAYVNLPPGEYTFEIRDSENGTVVDTVDVTVTSETVTTGYVVGYAAPPDDALDAAIQVLFTEDTEDALAGDSEEPTGVTETPTNETETPTDETETPTEGTETPTNETETPTEGTGTPTDGMGTPTDGTETPTNETETDGLPV